MEKGYSKLDDEATSSHEVIMNQKVDKWMFCWFFIPFIVIIIITIGAATIFEINKIDDFDKCSTLQISELQIFEKQIGFHSGFPAVFPHHYKYVYNVSSSVYPVDSCVIRVGRILPGTIVDFDQAHGLHLTVLGTKQVTKKVNGERVATLGLLDTNKQLVVQETINLIVRVSNNHPAGCSSNQTDGDKPNNTTYGGFEISSNEKIKQQNERRPLAESVKMMENFLGVLFATLLSLVLLAILVVFLVHHLKRATDKQQDNPDFTEDLWASKEMSNGRGCPTDAISPILIGSVGIGLSFLTMPLTHWYMHEMVKDLI